MVEIAVNNRWKKRYRGKYYNKRNKLVCGRLLASIHICIKDGCHKILLLNYRKLRNECIWPVGRKVLYKVSGQVATSNKHMLSV